MKKVKVGILGMGNMGKRHSSNMMTLDFVEIICMCSTHIDDSVNFINENGLTAKAYDDFDKMLEENKLDALFICLPPFAHNGQFEKAACMGIHIFIEKPIALTVERGRSMCEAALKNSVKTQVGYHMRFGGAIKRLKELIENGAAGKPTLFTANYECNSLHTPWWIDKEKSGGQILEQIIHLYDMSVYLLGQPSVATGFKSNLCHTGMPGYTVEDTSIGAIQFESGALASISGSNCALPGEWNGHFRVVFENLIANFTGFNNGEITYTSTTPSKKEILSYDNDVYLDEVKAFFETIVNGAPVIAPIEHGLKDLRLVSAVTESSNRNGKIINLQGEQLCW